MSEPLTIFLWNDETGTWSRRCEVRVPRKVMTASDLHNALTRLIEDHPHLADLPVHLLNMDGEEGVEGNLLTDLETDIFSDEQGMVLDLISWPTKKTDPA